MLAPWKKSYKQPRQHIKKQRHYFTNKSLSSQGYGFSSSHVWMWEMDYKESWVLKNRCFWTVVLEKTLESPLDCKEIKPVHPKGNVSGMYKNPKTYLNFAFYICALYCLSAILQGKHYNNICYDLIISFTHGNYGRLWSWPISTNCSGMVKGFSWENVSLNDGKFWEKSTVLWGR